MPRDFWAKHQATETSPFTQKESAVLIEAVRLITDAIRKGEPPRSLGAQSKIGPVVAKHPEGKPGHAWCQLYQVMIQPHRAELVDKHGVHGGHHQHDPERLTASSHGLHRVRSRSGREHRASRRLLCLVGLLVALPTEQLAVGQE